jgi:hypothetical protein
MVAGYTPNFIHSVSSQDNSHPPLAAAMPLDETFVGAPSGADKAHDFRELVPPPAESQVWAELKVGTPNVELWKKVMSYLSEIFSLEAEIVQCGLAAEIYLNGVAPYD